MATSRTGTVSYLDWRRHVLTDGQAHGITHCPLCGCQLNYEQGKQPNSAEPDHIIPWALGGRNTIDNGRVICRHCNQSRGDGRSRQPHARTEPATITNLVEW